MDKNLEKLDNLPLIDSVIELIEKSRHRVATSVNQELTLLYWQIGTTIKTEILKNLRADYGKKIIPELSEKLIKLYGNGFSKRNIQAFIKLSSVIEDVTILQTVSTKLSWSHLFAIIYIENDTKREFYVQMCIYERWSVRMLQERINSMLFERTAISKKPEETIQNELKVLEEEQKTTPDLVFRDPYFLDFLGLHDSYSEKDLESAILNNLQKFIVELGSDFAFLARQKRIIIDNEDFYIDLLFYHRGLKRLIAIDLKLGKFKAGYKGQMELYLAWLNENERKEGENEPIGLILCSEKSSEQIKYLMLNTNDKIQVSEYFTQLPSKELLLQKLEKAIEIAQNYNYKK